MLFLWVMLIVLTFELLNLKSRYVALSVLSLIASSSYSSVSWSLLLRQEMLSSAFVRQSRDPAIQVYGPALREAVAWWTFGFWVTPNTSAVWETVQYIFWHKDPLQDAFGESSSSSCYKKGVLFIGFLAVVGDLRPVQGKGASPDMTCPCSGLTAMYHLWMARNAYMSFLFQLSYASFSRTGKQVNLRLFTG